MAMKYNVAMKVIDDNPSFPKDFESQKRIILAGTPKGYIFCSEKIDPGRRANVERLDFRSEDHQRMVYSVAKRVYEEARRVYDAHFRELLKREVEKIARDSLDKQQAREEREGNLTASGIPRDLWEYV